jgi:hypothetical protein
VKVEISLKKYIYIFLLSLNLKLEKWKSQNINPTNMRRKIIKEREMRRKRKNEIIEVDRVLNHLNPVLVIIYSL